MVGDLDLDPEVDESDLDSDAERSCSGNAVNIRSSATLLNIDYCSPLGQRNKDKYNYKRANPVEHQDMNDELEGYEKFCHTPRKNTQFLDNLRNRENNSFPITFNKREHIPDHQCHWIKFTRWD